MRTSRVTVEIRHEDNEDPVVVVGELLHFSLSRGLYEDARVENIVRLRIESIDENIIDPRDEALRTWDGERKPPVL